MTIFNQIERLVQKHEQDSKNESFFRIALDILTGRRNKGNGEFFASIHDIVAKNTTACVADPITKFIGDSEEVFTKTLFANKQEMLFVNYRKKSLNHVYGDAFIEEMAIYDLQGKKALHLMLDAVVVPELVIQIDESLNDKKLRQCSVQIEHVVNGRKGALFSTLKAV